jgi:hypothetical protein
LSGFGRIGRFTWRVRGIFRHFLSVRGLWQWTGWWETVNAAAAALVLGTGSWLKGSPWSVTGLIFLGAFALASVIWRAFCPPQGHGPQPPPGNAASASTTQRRQESLESRLEFGLIHAGAWVTDAFLQSLVIDIRNVQTAVVNTAKNVSARIQFVLTDGTTFTVTSGAWLTKRTGSEGIVQGGLTTSTDLEGGEEQPFVLLLIKKRDRSVWAFRNLDAPVGVCGVGRWIAHVRVISDNAQTLEGSIGFHVLRGNELQFDQPTAFLSRSDR